MGDKRKCLPIGYSELSIKTITQSLKLPIHLKQSIKANALPELEWNSVPTDDVIEATDVYLDEETSDYVGA
jgi:hypothetical protein